MTSPVHEKTKFELKYWKECYHNLNRKYHLLKEEKENDDCSSAKRARKEDDENSLDPLKKLPDSCAQIIMQYLTAKDLLNAMEVSKYWKHFVESKNFLMNRITDKVVVKPANNNYPLPLYGIDDDNIKRAYKHMEGPLKMLRGFMFIDNAIVNPIIYYAPTLETLTIRRNYWYENDSTDEENFNLKGCDFPNLRKLFTWNLNIFKDFSFPALTHLAVRHDLYQNQMFNLNEFKKVLSKFPKLKILDTEWYNLLLRNDNVPSNNSISVDTWIINAKQPEIEFISISNYHPNFMKSQQNSLVKLELTAISFQQMSWLLHDLKLLKSLSIGKLEYEGDEDFTRNYNIERLRIFNFDRFEDFNQRFCEKLQFLLLAIPSLSELTLFTHLNEQILKYLASSMPHLKKLICKEHNEETSSVYAEIRNNPQQYFNSSFDFIADPNCDFHEIRNEFQTP